MREIMVKPKSIILEPEGRNTAPAIAIASLKALQEYKDPILLILSSDHEINNIPEFTKSINISINLAQEGKLVIFGFTFGLFYHLSNGIRHLFWDAGYGYDLKDAYISGFAVIFSSISLTLISWLIVYFKIV